MAVTFPTTLDSFTDRSSGDTISEDHMNDVQDAIEFLEAKVGIDGSAVTSSLDYLIDHIPANAVDSDAYVDGSIDLIHMSANSVDSNQYVDGSIDRVHLSADIIDGTKIADDVINSEHYVAASIDTEHIALLNITEGLLAASSVGQAKLKTTSQELTTASASATISFTNIGAYGFVPQFKVQSPYTATYSFNNTTASQTYGTSMTLGCTGGGTAYAKITYVTASGEVYWVFFLVDKATKKIISSSFCPDHPCLGNGGKPLLCPHPFGDYDSSLHEVVLVNPSKEQLAEMRKRIYVDDDTTPDRSLLQVILEDYRLDYSTKVSWPTEPVTVRVENAEWDDPEQVKIIKKVIPKDQNIKLASLKLK